MKILFGIQGTGNGHISRSRTLALALKKQGIHVDYIFSGRDEKEYFDMEAFTNYRTYKGMSFATFEGRIDFNKTFKQVDALKLLKDVHRLDLSSYDLVLNDFEPISAWAAKQQKVKSLAISNQAAYSYLHSSQLITNSLMKFYAPTTYSMGLYWFHFGYPLIPPIVDKDLKPSNEQTDLFLIYLPFEALNEVKTLLHHFPDKYFVCFHPNITENSEQGNIRFRKYSRTDFVHYLKTCRGIISNAGFSLISESLVLGKKLLIKPLKGQFEQVDNANYLKQLGLAYTMETLSFKEVQRWFDKPALEPIVYPDVATEIAKWLLEGDFTAIKTLSKRLWEQSHLPKQVEQRIMTLGWYKTRHG